MLRLSVSVASAAWLLLAYATLSVTSDPPGAAVYVDGQYVGQTPIDIENLEPGDHRVRLVKDGYLENGRLVTVTAGKSGTLQVRLTAKTAADALPDGQAGGGISSGGGGGGGSRKWLWIGAAGAGAAATGLILATRNHEPKLGAITAAPTTGLLAASTIAFNANATDDDGDSLTYTWDFGDGTTGSGATPTHVYQSASAFNARVKVSDGKKEVTGTVNVTIRSLNGTWRGTFEGIAETFVFTQSGSNVTGTISDVFGPGTLAGTVQPPSPRVRFTVTQPPYNPFVYTGDPSADVNTLTGVVNGSGYNNAPLTLTRQ